MNSGPPQPNLRKHKELSSLDLASQRCPPPESGLYDDQYDNSARINSKTKNGFCGWFGFGLVLFSFNGRGIEPEGIQPFSFFLLLSSFSLPFFLGLPLP